jgi:hypothetical protein
MGRHQTGAHRPTSVLLVAAFVLAGCAPRHAPDPPSPAAPAPPAAATPLDETTVVAAPDTGAQPKIASDPVRIADDLVADEQTLRRSSETESTLTAAARRQQAAYRAIGQHTEWDAIIRARIPVWLSHTYELNVDARRQLYPMTEVKDTVPAWRIVPPAPADALLGYYREAEAASGVGWNYLAAINLVETRFGSINGVSTAGAQGPMQFLPATFAAYGDGGDIHAPRDSIMAAGRYLAANGFGHDAGHALFRYNNSDRYVRAVDDYAQILATDPGAFAGYYRWDVYYRTTAGDILLPIGYEAMEPIPATTYLAEHPQ